jgi:hypothetical protein
MSIGVRNRVLKAALTRLTNGEKDFARWGKDYQRERTKRLLKIGKLKATVRRLTGQANSVSEMIITKKICKNPHVGSPTSLPDGGEIIAA